MKHVTQAEGVPLRRYFTTTIKNVTFHFMQCLNIKRYIVYVSRFVVFVLASYYIQVLTLTYTFYTAGWTYISGSFYAIIGALYFPADNYNIRVICNADKWPKVTACTSYASHYTRRPISYSIWHRPANI